MAIGLGLSMIGFGAGSSSGGGAPLLDGSESDGTNLFSGTDAMTSSWGAGAVNTVFTNAAAVASNGANDASSLIEAGNTARHILYQQVFGLAANQAVRFSVYAKATGRRYLQLLYGSSSGTAGNIYAYFDLQTGNVTDSGVTGGAQSATNVSMTAAVNGYYKCTVDCLASATTTSTYMIFSLSDVGTFGAPLDSDCPSYLGDSVSGAYLWRPKLVQL
jgi:hypothetical protein